MQQIINNLDYLAHKRAQNSFMGLYKSAEKIDNANSYFLHRNCDASK